MGESGSGFRQRIADYVRTQARPIDKLGHQPRLYALTREIGSGLTYDDDVVYAAVWIHDLGVFLGHRPEDPVELAGWDNVRYAVEKTPALLDGCGFPQEKIAAVVDAIRHHQPDSKPKALESVLVHDADILEQLGSIGILRIAAKIGRDTRYRTFSEAAETLRMGLKTLPGRLMLPSARVLAGPRIELLGAFLRELEVEAMGELH